MAKKPTVTTVASGYYGRQALNDNFTSLRDAFDNTLSRDGSTPNAMGADLDMNSNDILNAQTVNTEALRLDGVLVGSADLSAAGATLYSDNYTGDGSTVAYTMSYQPFIKDNTQVYIDGVYQNKAGYSISGTTLTFSEAPPLNANIEIVVARTLDFGSDDAANVGYTQGGTGSTNRTVEAKLQETVSVKDFGAVGDGVTDDTAAINAALAVSKHVTIPSGMICLITSTIVVENQTLELLGQILIKSNINGIALGDAGWVTSNGGRNGAGASALTFDHGSGIEVDYFGYDQSALTIQTHVYGTGTRVAGAGASNLSIWKTVPTVSSAQLTGEAIRLIAGDASATLTDVNAIVFCQFSNINIAYFGVGVQLEGAGSFSGTDSFTNGNSFSNITTFRCVEDWQFLGNNGVVSGNVVSNAMCQPGLNTGNKISDRAITFKQASNNLWQGFIWDLGVYNETYVVYTPDATVANENLVVCPKEGLFDRQNIMEPDLTASAPLDGIAPLYNLVLSGQTYKYLGYFDNTTIINDTAHDFRPQTDGSNPAIRLRSNLENDCPNLEWRDRDNTIFAAITASSSGTSVVGYNGLNLNPTSGDYLTISNLPTSSAGLPSGAVWNDAGTLKIV